MSKNLEQVIQRAISDAAFRRQLQANPEAALRGFKLTSDEEAALRSGDPGKLISLGIDQRMSKTFSFGGDADLASRATAGGDMTSVGGASLIDPAATSATRDLTAGNSASEASIDPGTVAGQTSIGDPMSATSTSDALEDQSHAFAAHNAGDDAVRSAVRDVEPTSGTTIGYGASYPEHGGLAGASSVASNVRDVAPSDFSANAASDAIEDQSHAFAAHNAGDDAVRSAVRDVEPTDLSGSTIGYGASYPEHGGLAGASSVASNVRDVAPSDFSANAASDAIEDQSHAFAAHNAGDDAVRSAVRDVEPGSFGSGLVAPVEGSPESFAFSAQNASANAASDAIEDQSHAFAAHNAGDDAVRSAVHDVEPGSFGSGLVAPVEGSPESFAFRDTDGDAFLSESQATQYSTSTDANWSSDMAEDTAHAFTPGTEGIDAGSSESGHGEPEVSN